MATSRAIPSDFRFRALTSEDWKQAQALNELDGSLRIDNGLLLEVGALDGTYVSPVLDSGIEQCIWHRITLDADIPPNASIRISLAVTDEESSGEPMRWAEQMEFRTVKDALISARPGRYLAVKAEFHREANADTPVLRQVKLYYPRQSYLRYLPAVYQENEGSAQFLERFLSLFESAFFDSDETISRIPSYLDPQAPPYEFVPWLAQWVSLDLYDLLGDRNREFILRAWNYYRQKGTINGIASLVSFLTGYPCCVKEFHNNVFRSYGMEHFSEEEPGGILDCKRDSERSDTVCTKFHREISKTIDTRDLELLAHRGSYCDRIHYAAGTSAGTSTSEPVTYLKDSVGLFIFLPLGKSLLVDKKKLYKIIKSFLPVFVQVHITLVPGPALEDYAVRDILDEYIDRVFEPEGERFDHVMYEYRDDVPAWKWIYTYGPQHPRDGSTYDPNNGATSNFRTWHSHVRTWRVYPDKGTA